MLNLLTVLIKTAFSQSDGHFVLVIFDVAIFSSEKRGAVQHRSTLAV